MTSVYAASIGDQAIAKIDRQYSSRTGMESRCGSCPCIL